MFPCLPVNMMMKRYYVMRVRYFPKNTLSLSWSGLSSLLITCDFLFPAVHNWHLKVNGEETSSFNI